MMLCCLITPIIHLKDSEEKLLSSGKEERLDQAQLGDENFSDIIGLHKFLSRILTVTLTLSEITPHKSLTL